MQEDSAVWKRLREAGRQKLRFDIDVYVAAQEMYNEEPTPGATEIAERLARMFPQPEDSERPTSPSESAIRDWIGDGVIKKEASDARWYFGAFTPEDDALVIDVLGWYAHDPRLPMPSLSGSRWVVRVRRAAPSLSPTRRNDMALVAYLARLANTGRAGANEAAHVLAMAPWIDGGDDLVHAMLVGVVSEDVGNRVLATLEMHNKRTDLDQGETDGE